MNAPRPALSVVVVTLVGESTLERLLEALRGQDISGGLQVIVPCDDRLGDCPALRERFPEVDFPRVTGRRTYAELRSLGVERAVGEIVAVTEDHCQPVRGWADAVVRAHTAERGAVGGPVDKRGPDGAVGWAVYFLDYGRYMPPRPEGPAAELTDLNVSYKRADLAAIRETWAGEFHEPSVHAALESRGLQLWFAPAMTVEQHRPIRLGEALRDRYVFGRLFGATRVAEAPATRRLIAAAASPLLPPLLVWRVCRGVYARRRRRAELLRALPAILLLASAWALGEFMGYVTRRADPSLAPGAPRQGGGEG